MSEVSFILCMCSRIAFSMTLLSGLDSPLALSRSNSTVFQGEQSNGITDGHVTLQSFINPSGHSFTAATFAPSNRLIAVGSEGGTIDATWYPGYSWQPLTHPACGRHLGWRFTRVPELNSFTRNKKQQDSGNTEIELHSFDLLIWSEIEPCEGSGTVIVNEEESILEAPDLVANIDITHSILHINASESWVQRRL